MTLIVYEVERKIAKEDIARKVCLLKAKDSELFIIQKKGVKVLTSKSKVDVETVRLQLKYGCYSGS